MNHQYDADYFLHGRETGKSLYENYRWLPDLTIPMARSIIAHLGIEKNQRILDFGCARGYTVKAFNQLGYDAWGIDISEWAIANCDNDVVDSVICGDAKKIKPNFFNWIIAKDVLEHIHAAGDTIDHLLSFASVGMFAVVPLAENGYYVVQEYEKDVTHVHRMSLMQWTGLFIRHGWEVTASYRVPGVKDNYSTWERGNGFITCHRLEN